MSRENPKTDFFFNKSSRWQEEYRELRKIVLACGLTEDLKWGQPCYTEKKKNVVLIHGFKDYCALLFLKGVLLSDPESILVKQTGNVQSARQIRFSNVKDIKSKVQVLRAYIREALEVEKAGLEVEYKQTREYEVPEEFQSLLGSNPVLKEAFESLTPGRQRAYLLYFSSAKRSETRTSRISKYTRHILDGRGMDD